MAGGWVEVAKGKTWHEGGLERDSVLNKRSQVYQALPTFSVRHNKRHLEKAESISWRIQGTIVYGMRKNGLHFFLTLSFQAMAIEIVSGEISNSTYSEYLKDYLKRASSILCGCIV